MINKKLLKPINKSGYVEIVGTTTHDTLLNRDLPNQHPISAITDLQTTLDAKQAKLTAGTGIDITGDTISSSGGTTNGVTLDTDQTITGRKTFSKSIQIEYNDKKFYIDTTASGALIIHSPNSFQLYSNGATSFAFYKDFVDCLNSKITQVGDPTDAKDATTKKYVDDGLNLKADKNFVDEEFVKTNTSITNLAKSVDILVGDYAVSWASKTTNTSAGTNLKTLFGDELWNEIILPANKYKYILKCYTGATSEGNYYSLPLNCINQVDTGSQKITLFAACNINAMRFNDPANRTTINATLMVNNIGDVRLYVLFGTELNANFSVGNIKLFRRQLIV